MALWEDEVDVVGSDEKLRNPGRDCMKVDLILGKDKDVLNIAMLSLSLNRQDRTDSDIVRAHRYQLDPLPKYSVLQYP